MLVPTDFSKDAALATEAATRILGMPGADRRIAVLHAYRAPYEATYLPPPVLLDAISAADTKVKRMIDETTTDASDGHLAREFAAALQTAREAGTVALLVTA